MNMRTAERSGYFVYPVDRKSSNMMTKRKEKDKRKIYSVYFVHFRMKTDPTISFLKVGYTKNIQNRFLNDADNFHITFLNEVDELKKDSALHLEQSIHEIYHSLKRFPVKGLSSGNFECYPDDVELIREFNQIFTSFNKS